MDHIHALLTTQGHGGPPRMRDQLNVGSTSETTRTWKTRHTIHAPIHSNKDDYDGQMISGDRVGLKLPDICLIGEVKTRNTSPGKPVQTGDRTRARWVRVAHATTCSIAVDMTYIDSTCYLKYFDIARVNVSCRKYCSQIHLNFYYNSIPPIVILTQASLLITVSRQSL